MQVFKTFQSCAPGICDKLHAAAHQVLLNDEHQHLLLDLLDFLKVTLGSSNVSQDLPVGSGA